MAPVFIKDPCPVNCPDKVMSPWPIFKKPPVHATVMLPETVAGVLELLNKGTLSAKNIALEMLEPAKSNLPLVVPFQTSTPLEPNARLFPILSVPALTFVVPV